MRVFLAGATGFIGGHVLEALAERGHEVTCLARGAGARRLAELKLPGVRVVEGEFTRPAEWEAHLADRQAVVNTVGIIRDSPGATFEAVHQDAAIALFEAARRAGVAKIVQVSAMGADAGAQSRYHRTKRAADERLAALGVPYVVLRPSFVYGAGDSSMSFFASLAAQPITAVPGDGQYRVQPIHVGDLARAVALAIESEGLRDAVVDVGGGETVTFDAMLDTLARWLGKPGGARKLHVPWALMRLAAAWTDATGGRGPITGEELAMLRRGNCGDNAAFVRLFGFEPLPFSLGIARRPRTQEALWHARLAPLRLPLRLSIAFVWLATGIVSAFVYPLEESLKLMAGVGFTGALATPILYATSFFEIGLAAATALGWRVRWMGALQLALMFGFMAILTAGTPELWWHPFGPLTKNIPLIGATLVMMALEE